MTVRAHEQSITSGNFDGTAPVDATPTASGDVEKRYAAGTTGGLFDFQQTGPVELCLIDLKLAGQDTWTLSIVDDQSVATVLWSGTIETSFKALDSDSVVLLKGDRVKLVTTGASTGACRARIGVR